MCFLTILCIADKNLMNLVKLVQDRAISRLRDRALLRFYRALLRSYNLTGIGKMVNFNPVLWVWVWWYVNGTGLFAGPRGADSEYIFPFFVSRAVSEE